MLIQEINKRIYKEVPKEIIILILRLNHFGYKIYVVGGFIRNIIMNKKTKDLDLSTSLKPTELVNFCKRFNIHYALTGIKYGTVTIIIKGLPYEVTTFRTESSYDGRRPKVVHFTDK